MIAARRATARGTAARVVVEATIVDATRTLLRGGKPHVVTFDDAATLLDVARRALGARAAARGCDDRACGSCRMLLDGNVVHACAVPWGEVADGATLETFEDVEGDPAAQRALAAFEHERPTRCRLCVAGLGVTAVDLARRGVDGTADAVDAALASATCVCTGRASLRRSLLARG